MIEDVREYADGGLSFAEIDDRDDDGLRGSISRSIRTALARFGLEFDVFVIGRPVGSPVGFGVVGSVSLGWVTEQFPVSVSDRSDLGWIADRGGL